MHKEFPRWYTSVNVGIDQSRLLARWNGITSAIENADWNRVEALIRLSFGGKATPTAEQVQGIQNAFLTADATFEQKGNARELQILSASALAVLMEDESEDLSGEAALATSTAFLSGARKTDLPMDLARLAESALNRQGVANRKRPSLLTKSRAEVPKVGFEKAIAKITEQSDSSGIAGAFALAADATKTALATLVQRHAASLEAIEKFTRAQDEELQLLWWLVGGYSEEYDCAFESVPAESQPFVLAYELSNHTEILPGPPSIKALLMKAGLKSRKKIAISDAVNSLRPEWATPIVEGIQPSPLTSPLHFAIVRQLETGRGEDWIAGWAASTGIAKGFSLSAVELAQSFYRERLLELFK